MKEEIVASNLGKGDIARLVEKLSNSLAFRVVSFGKNLRYVLPGEEKSPEIIPGGVSFERFNPRIIGGYDTSPQVMMADPVFAKQNYIGIIRKSSASIIIYDENDGRSKSLILPHAIDKLREIMSS